MTDITISSAEGIVACRSCSEHLLEALSGEK